MRSSRAPGWAEIDTLASTPPFRHVEAHSPSVSRTRLANGGLVETVTFWIFVAGLAWTPLWYGSNDLFAWGINAVLFPGLAVAYELSLLARNEPHPIALKTLRVPAVLFAAVVTFILVQNATAIPSLAHPIWETASKALGQPLVGSISVNRDLTTLALLRLITSASVFWIAVQLCRDTLRANRLIEAIATVGVAYSTYGLVDFAAKTGRLAWFGTHLTKGYVSSTFINRNSLATYAGICLLLICSLILRRYRHYFAEVTGSWRHRVACLIDATGQGGATLLAAAFLVLVALLLTGSRGGIVSTMLGLIVFGAITLSHKSRRLRLPIFGIAVAATVCVGFGSPLLDILAQRGLGDDNRFAVYLITLQSIMDLPFTGFGYGTFVDVFPMYRDRSIGLFGVWEQAHNTYLEVLQGLGLIFGSMLIATIALLARSCVNGAIERRENFTVPCVAVGVICLVGLHALVDFSLQIQAVTLTFAAILGAGFSQSMSSRDVLHD